VKSKNIQHGCPTPEGDGSHDCPSAFAVCAKVKGEPEPRQIVKDLPEGVEGYYDEKTNTIYISSKLSQERQAEILKHELQHYEQSKKGLLPKAKFISPEVSIAKFMEYLTDPQEVQARATEKGEAVPEIWNEVFKIKEQMLTDEITPLRVDKIAPTISSKVEPEKPLPGRDEFERVHALTEWHFRRIMGKLKPNDPKPVVIKEKAIRIYFKNGGNGIIAADMLKEAGIDASSVAPFSVDIPIDESNQKEIMKLVTPMLTEGKSSFLKESAGPSIATSLGLTYNGEQLKDNEFAFYTFTDPQTGSTFGAKDLESARKTLEEMREKFKGKALVIPDRLFVMVSGKKYEVKSLEQASKLYQSVIKEAGAGVSEIPVRYLEPRIIDQNGKVIGRIAYNGKIFPGETWKSGVEPIYNPYASYSKEDSLEVLAQDVGNTLAYQQMHAKPDQYRELFDKLEAMTPAERQEWAVRNNWGSTEDMAYKSLFSTYTKIPLRKGETWRERAVEFIRKYHSGEASYLKEDSHSKPIRDTREGAWKNLVSLNSHECRVCLYGWIGIYPEPTKRPPVEVRALGKQALEGTGKISYGQVPDYWSRLYRVVKRHYKEYHPKVYGMYF
jgi:hypothetical protein